MSTRTVKEDTLCNGGIVSLYNIRTLEQLTKEVKRAISLNPSYSDVKLYFEGSMDYDDYPEAVLSLRGTRAMTEMEVVDEKHQESVKAYSKEKGVTFHEAGVLLKLKEKGVSL